MRVVDELAQARYPAGVGPGVYDIHSPHVPTVDEMHMVLTDAVKRLPVGQLWVNPDCGLKTRTEAEVLPALRNLVAAAKRVRESVV
jgi:5-methyltetrahydropteroyltriglutamate--homocysteine methyltransferase